MSQSRRLNLLLVGMILCVVVGVETALQRIEPPRWAVRQEFPSPPERSPASQSVAVFKPVAGQANGETRITVALHVEEREPVHPKIALKMRSLRPGRSLHAADIEPAVRRAVHDLGGRVSILSGGSEAKVWVEDLPADVAIHDLLTAIEEECGFRIVVEQDDRH